MRAQQVLEADISELCPGGEGVAICTLAGERRAVFVPGVAPGERVRIAVDDRRRPARGRVLELLTPSAERVPSPCAHVDRCGGCDWMFLAPAAQAREHARLVQRLLAGASSVEVVAHPAARALGYRTRARVHIEATRARVVAGMFARHTHEPADVDRCVVLDPTLDAARAALPRWLEGARGRGEAQLDLGRAASGARTALVDLRWTGELPGAVFARLERAIGARELGGARVFAGDVSRPATIGDPSPAVAGADGEVLRLAPGGFSQATEAENARLATRVRALAAALAPGPCLELYSGAGNLTVLLARDRDVVAVEQSHDACVAARANLEARGLSASVVEADASAYLAGGGRGRAARPLRGVGLVVLDPPREGARAACEAIATDARARPRSPAVIYVSCDPPTLARDVRILAEAGLVVTAVETFEMFPHTSHVETVVVLERPTGRP